MRLAIGMKHRIPSLPPMRLAHLLTHAEEPFPHARIVGQQPHSQRYATG